MPCNVTFMFIEASIELIPEEIRNHPVILKDSKRRKKSPSEMLLDDSRHHTAMKIIKNREKRGRPDIIHMCLLSVFDSPFGEVSDVYVHTIDGKVIKFYRGLRLPRNYNRFVGLMEQLLKDGKIESVGDRKRILIEVLDDDLKSVLQSLNPSQTLLLTEKGVMVNRFEIDNSKIVILIGAFAHGDFDREVLDVVEPFNPVPVSLGNKSLTSLYVTNRVICLLENLS